MNGHATCILIGVVALTTPASSEPPQARAIWTSIHELGDPPPTVTGHVVVDGRIVGGMNAQGDFLVDDWQRTQSGYGPATWTEVMGGPSPMVDAAGGTHQDDGYSIVFGGRTGLVVFDETWILSDGEWTISNATGPSARHLHAMASSEDGIYMHGGLGAADQFGNWIPLEDIFWKFDGNAWQPLDQLGGLPGRWDHAMVALPSGDLILHGGRMGDPDDPVDLQDTWLYNGLGWSILSTEGGPGGPSVALMYDDVVDAVVASNGAETWILNESTWYRIQTDPSGSGDPAPGFRFDSESGGVAFAGPSSFDGGRILTLVNRPSNDCDEDGIDDDIQIAQGASDCDHDGVLDVCEIAAGALDCDGNGVPDACQVAPTYTNGSEAFQVRYGWTSPFHDQMAISRFTVVPGGESIGTVWYPFSPVGSARPDLMRLGIWLDTGSGFIEDATLIREIPLQIPRSSTQWARFDFDETVIGPAGTRFFVGIASRRNSPGAPCVSVYVRRNASAPNGGDAGWVGVSSGIFDFDDMSLATGSNHFITNLIAFDAPWENSVATIQMRVGPESPLDADGDFALDDCGTCPGDADGDGIVGGSDLGILFLEWGPCVDCVSDLDGNGQVDGADLGGLFLAWGPCP